MPRARKSEAFASAQIGMSEKPFLYSLLNTYLENRIQNKYPINHEESIREWLTEAAGAYLYAP